MPTVWRGRHRLIFCWLIFMQAVHPGRKTLEEMAWWTRHDHRLALWPRAQSRLLERASARQLVGAGSLGHPAAASQWHPVSVWRRQSRRQTRHQESCGAERAYQSASSLVFWPALRAADGGMGRLSRAGGLSAHSAQTPCGVSQRKCLVSRDGGGVCPTAVGQAGHYGRGCRLCLQGQHADGQDRDKADATRRWGFVFAIARTWKTVEEKSLKTS